MAQNIRDYEKLAVDIVEAVGGKENIINATRCATRLRLVLKETPKDANKKVSGLTGVITVVENNGQFQVVIGTHVGKVFDKVQTIVDLDDSSKDEAPKGTIFKSCNSYYVGCFCAIYIYTCSSGDFTRMFNFN